MSEKHTPQWPDNIVSGKIRYGRADNYDGFFLADATHGPTFGAVTFDLHLFSYPGQTEAIAAQLVNRWNVHDDLVAALEGMIAAYWTGSEDYDPPPHCIKQALAALAKARKPS